MNNDNMRLHHVASQQRRRLARRYPFLRRISVATCVLTLLWLYLISWGERSVYEDHVTDCQWDGWEDWPDGAQPHHLVFIADPQLVDPHTYPGRPWPLSMLTERYTDLYMARNFRLLNEKLDPDTIIFLGDLFDGGREWATERPKELPPLQLKRLEELGIRLPEDQKVTDQKAPEQKRSQSTYYAALKRPHSHEPTLEEHNIGKDGQDLREFVPGENGRWSKWDNKQWLEDFRRFSRIFFDNEQLYPHPPDRKFFALYDVPTDPVSVQNGASQTTSQEYATTGGKLRRIISSLPGNHDVGFGPGVQLPIRDRFVSHFGESNRLDVIGNHTFVSLDVLSLAAHSYFGSNGMETDTEQDDYRHIWGPGMQFLEQLKAPARKVVAEALHEYYPENGGSPRWHHEVTDPELIEQPSSEEIEEEKQRPKPNLPVVLLSHVPLFRPINTDCGPLRENGNAIKIQMGYQYQNVLTQGLSRDIITKVSEAAGDIVQVFSGDDHDYCDVLHRYNVAPDEISVIKTQLTHIREITVKSFSWAMGVRWPGFLLVSLWNPVDENGISLGSPQYPSMQTYLCLLPNQLAIFLDYALLLAVTVLVLIVDTLYWDSRLNPSLGTEDNPLSPVTRRRMSLPRFQLGTNGPVNSLNATTSSKGRQRGASTSSSSHSRNNSQYLGTQRSFNARTRPINSPVSDGPLINQAGYFPPTQLEEDESDEEAHLSIQKTDRDDGQAKWKWRRRSPSRLPEKLRKALEDMGLKMLIVGLPSGLFYLFLVSNG